MGTMIFMSYSFLNDNVFQCHFLPDLYQVIARRLEWEIPVRFTRAVAAIGAGATGLTLLTRAAIGHERKAAIQRFQNLIDP